ncbi:unnamed protein product [Allacma fusca]|uniref:Uncharacterized protein n=1 Tax=Allacma fusca TaxID=39272 RepID=A0A8J2LCL6_9HEXA|nr:unnamed protein product [Allacma fusca]
MKAHSKQSPVEELLRQADQLISTQKPRAEVYAAMAESLGLAWKDLNNQLEQRKTILKFNTSLHTELEECSAKIIQVENASCENPETIEACQELISRSKSLRKSMLSSFLRCLEEGQTLIEKLEEQRTIDSRPDYGAIQAQFCELA